MPMRQNAALELAHYNFPSFLRQREQAKRLEPWLRGEQEGHLYQPDRPTEEYTELRDKSPSPWGAAVVRAVVQTAELVGARLPGANDNMRAWRSWQLNRMDARQRALYEHSCGYGAAFVVAESASDPITGLPISKWRTEPLTRMAAFYGDDDEWPDSALRAEPFTDDHGLEAGWNVRLFDESSVYYLSCKNDGDRITDWTFIERRPHGAGVTPVVRYAPNLDLDGRANSDLQGLIPLLARIDQDVFDRLIVQRFGAWKVRYAAGLIPKDDPIAQAVERQRLRVEDILISSSHETKFGTLDGTSPDGFINAKDADLRDLSALGQIPPHHLLGLSSNLQAESLAAAEAGLQRKGREHRLSWGESHEQLLRLDAHMRGDLEEAQAVEMEVRWRDTESRSLEQAAMALGMLATNLKVPVEVLWERIPGWTDGDVDRAKKLVEDGSIDLLLSQLEPMLAGGQGAPAA